LPARELEGVPGAGATAAEKGKQPVRSAERLAFAVAASNEVYTYFAAPSRPLKDLLRISGAEVVRHWRWFQRSLYPRRN